MTRIEIAALLMQALAGDDTYFGTVEKPYNPWPWIVKEALNGADELLEQTKEK